MNEKPLSPQRTQRENLSSLRSLRLVRFKAFVLLMISILFGGVSIAAMQSGGNALPASPIGRCTNLGNALEAPTEGEWGLTLQESYFSVIAEGGFDTIRLPVKWSAHSDENAPYTIDPEFFDRIDTVIGWALDANLQVILNIHHYDEFMTDPTGNHDRLLSLWRQIGEHYADQPDGLIFEALNEPTMDVESGLWNTMQAETIAAIRESNPTRWIVVGGNWWNSIDGLMNVELPDDPRLIATFHFYEPFEFTHQGAEWMDGSEAWIGTTWGSSSDRLAMINRLQTAADWGAENGVPVLMGEFGAYSRADIDARVQWTIAAREDAETLGLGWCYWEFAAGFGFYDRDLSRFNEIYSALIPGK